MGIVLFNTALAIYLAAAVAYGASLWSRRVFPARMATGLTAFALAIHSLSLIAGWMAVTATPFLGLKVVHSLFAWAMAAAYLALQLKTKTRVLGVFVSPVICLLMIIASRELGGAVAAPELLRGSLVMLHVVLSVSGEALFAVASLAGLMYLIQDSLLRGKMGGGLSRLFPSLHDLDRINYLCLIGGFSLLTLGGLAGSAWARMVWGSHWQWDTKQVWTLLAWAFYAFLLHQRLAIGWRGRTAARWSLAAFLALLILLILGKVFFPTIHRFV